MEQTSWFDGRKESDPLYAELQKLDLQEVVYIDTFTIRKNEFDLYEIEDDQTHDCVSTLEKCYQYVTGRL
ncbi:hypothetical protein [Halobacillus salinus]|uniref:Uncharacterized protein n=1 Tax=Halobacillus salinus TaxID=192814 RepID=A0A4Z0GW94_9BACI|nr:hypothetical protein [Halobacillus salinus]TGB02015.1 hypothetical protein E4663_15400 [Halobacillus salinus]